MLCVPSRLRNATPFSEMTFPILDLEAEKVTLDLLEIMTENYLRHAASMPRRLVLISYRQVLRDDIKYLTFAKLRLVPVSAERELARYDNEQPRCKSLWQLQCVSPRRQTRCFGILSEFYTVGSRVCPRKMERGSSASG